MSKRARLFAIGSSPIQIWNTWYSNLDITFRSKEVIGKEQEPQLDARRIPLETKNLLTHHLASNSIELQHREVMHRRLCTKVS